MNVKQTIVVDVTLKHIIHGCRGSNQHCPIALALWERADVEYVSVGNPSIRVNLKDPRAGDRPVTFKGQLPRNIETWVRQFDLAHNVQPVAFQLHLSSSF